MSQKKPNFAMKMKTTKIFKIGILTFVALIGSNNCTMAQETDVQKPRPTFGLEYTGEVQTDFKKLKSVNLLELGAQLPLTSKLSVELGSISVLTTDEAILTNCLQNFSSIDAPNIPFALTTAGLAWQINERHHLFAGIHRIDDNYFCSDMLGLFTHSSCGAFPTITANYDIAAYPVSALGIHYGYTKDAFSLKTSLYNGVGYKDFSKRDNVFRICPESDGVFLMAQGEYDKNATRAYVGGSVLYSDLHATAPKQMRPVVWAYAEQDLTERFSVLAGYSHAFGNNIACHDFYLVCGRYAYKKAEFGVFSSYTRIDEKDEWATELTCNIQFNKVFSLQPALHFANTDGKNKCVGLVRVGVKI